MYNARIATLGKRKKERAEPGPRRSSIGGRDEEEEEEDEEGIRMRLSMSARRFMWLLIESFSLDRAARFLPRDPRNQRTRCTSIPFPSVFAVCLLLVSCLLDPFRSARSRSPR